jgi:hypothetical protein
MVCRAFERVLMEMEKGAILSSILVAILSWVCLGFLVSFTSPGTLTQIAFFLLLFVALTATFVPIAFFFNHRFAGSEGGEVSVRAVRQSGLAALFLVLCAWLRMIRSLNWPVALLVLSLLLSIEVVILTRR